MTTKGSYRFVELYYLIIYLRCAAPLWPWIVVFVLSACASISHFEQHEFIFCGQFHAIACHIHWYELAKQPKDKADVTQFFFVSAIAHNCQLNGISVLSFLNGKQFFRCCFFFGYYWCKRAISKKRVHLDVWICRYASEFSEALSQWILLTIGICTHLLSSYYQNGYKQALHEEQ